MPEERYMHRALELAREAAAGGDVPVGCVIVKDGVILGTGRNRREARQDATAHAEVEAIRMACQSLGSWHLDGCTLYVTLEPCPMCAGAIILSRIETVVYGAASPKSGCCGSVLSLFQEDFNHHPAVYGGVLEKECGAELSRFFGGNSPS